MQKISVAIITFNEEKKIAQCIESVKHIADEIVVVDSLSTDGTKRICNQYNVIFIEQPFLGYIEQKNFAVTKTTNDFVLSLDADEALDEQLKTAILKVKQTGLLHDGYSMNRCANFNGKWIKHGTWYPDRNVRLFNKHKAYWGGINPHDKIETLKNATTQFLQGDILHYTYDNLADLVIQNNRFTTIQAKAMYQLGKRATPFNIFINPLVAFVNGYILKGGFLNGIDGFVIAKSVAYNTMLKYAKLLQLQKNK